jgi:hypothetical protein
VQQEILEYSSILSGLEPKEVVILTEIVAPMTGLEVDARYKCKLDRYAVITSLLEYASHHRRRQEVKF